MGTVSEPDEQFAFFLGLPGNAEALELGRRLRLVNQRDEFTRYRIKRELARFLALALEDVSIWAA